MKENPYAPRNRSGLTANVQRTPRFMAECLYGDNLYRIDEYVAKDCIRDTPGISRGQEGVLNHTKEVALFA